LILMTAISGQASVSDATLLGKKLTARAQTPACRPWLANCPLSIVRNFTPVDAFLDALAVPGFTATASSSTLQPSSSSIKCAAFGSHKPQADT
jgi:hypothetical protein